MGGNSQDRVRKPARPRAESNGFEVPDRCVPATLDKSLSLQQCAFWLQQPELVLQKLIGNGTLKLLPLPGADYRLHARSVLLQMGIGGKALGNSTSTATTNATALTETTHRRPSRPEDRLPSRLDQELRSNGGVARSDGHDGVPGAGEQPHGSRIKASAPQMTEPKETVVRRNYESHGRKVEVTYRLGATPRHKIAESNLLDVVVSSLKPGHTRMKYNTHPLVANWPR